MRRKWGYMYFAVAAAAVMGMSAPAAAAETSDSAIETEAGETETTAETENIAEAAVTDTEIPEDVKLEIGETEIVIVNETNVRIDSAETEEDTAGDGEETLCTVILTDEEGQHRFEHVMPEKWTEPSLVEDHGFLYIRYTDAEGNSKEDLETADMAAPEEELTMWAVTPVNMRREASADAEVAAVVGLNDECTVTGILPGWYQVEYNGETGYINHKFLTDDKDEADAAVKQEEAAVAAAEAAAAAAARNAANSYSFSGSGSGKKSSGSSKSSGSKKSSGSSSKSKEECLTNGLMN